LDHELGAANPVLGELRAGGRVDERVGVGEAHAREWHASREVGGKDTLVAAVVPVAGRERPCAHLGRLAVLTGVVVPGGIRRVISYVITKSSQVVVYILDSRK
jgi:hypothetical protein